MIVSLLVHGIRKMGRRRTESHYPIFRALVRHSRPRSVCGFEETMALSSEQG